jgi:hypothetical protein
VARNKAGLIFDPVDHKLCEQILDDIGRTGETITWDPASIGRPMDLDGGIAMILVGAVVGAVWSIANRVAHASEGIRDRTISLHLR